jgi:hypothetical protein
MYKFILTTYIIISSFKLSIAQRYVFNESEIKTLQVPRECYIEFPDTITFHKLLGNGQLTSVNDNLLELEFEGESKDEFLVAGNSKNIWWFRLIPFDNNRKELLQIPLCDTTSFFCQEIEMGYEFEKNIEQKYNLSFIKHLIDYCKTNEKGVFFGNNVDRKNKQGVVGYKYSWGKYHLIALTIINSSRTDEKSIAFIDSGEMLPVFRKYDNTCIPPGQSKTYRLAYLNELPDDIINIYFKDGSDLILNLK